MLGVGPFHTRKAQKEEPGSEFVGGFWSIPAVGPLGKKKGVGKNEYKQVGTQRKIGKRKKKGNPQGLNGPII